MFFNFCYQGPFTHSVQETYTYIMMLPPPKCTKYIYTVQCALVGHTAQCASILALSSGSILLTFVFYLYVVVVFILRVLFII